MIAKLKEARSVLLKEKADVKAMHDHTDGDEDQARRSHPDCDSDRAAFENPLRKPPQILRWWRRSVLAHLCFTK